MNIASYFIRLNGMRSQVSGLPRWGMWILMILALPGLAMLALSILACVVSIAALLLLTLPAYSLLSRIGSGGQSHSPENYSVQAADPFGWARDSAAQAGGSGRKQVSVKIVE